MVVNPKKLKKLMIDRDMTNKRLAAVTGLNPTTISNITRGLACSDATAIKIADALGVSVEAFKGR